MKIGLSTTAIQRGQSPEGRYTLGLARALAAEATRHEFVLFVFEADLPLFDFTPPTMRIVPVPEIHRPPTRDVLWHQFTLPRLAQELGLDVLHIPTHRRLLWSRPCGLVATVHGSVAEAAKASRPAAADGSFFLRQLARRQDALVAVNEATAAEFAQRLGWPTDRITVIYNGVDHERFAPAERERTAAAIAKQHGIHPPFLLCVAPLDHPDGNHTRLITAFSLFKTTTPSPWQLVFVGRDGRGAAQIHGAIQRSPFAQDIRCVGAVSSEELPTWYRAAGLLLHVPLRDHDGQTAIEAMACGCPVLASRYGAVGELVGDAAVRVDPTDLGELRRQLPRLAFEAELRQQLSAAGQARARQFDWRRTAAATLEIYARVARRASQPLLATTALTRATH